MSSFSMSTARRRPTLNSMGSTLTEGKLDWTPLPKETGPTMEEQVADREVLEEATMRDRTQLSFLAKTTKMPRRVLLRPSKERKFCFDHLLICLSYLTY